MAGRGFAALSEEQRREVSRLGGKAAAGAPNHHRWNGEEAKAAGRKGGLATAAKRYRLNHREDPSGHQG